MVDLEQFHLTFWCWSFFVCNTQYCKCSGSNIKEGPLLGQVVLLENYTISTVLCILFLKGLFIIVLTAKMHFLC